MICGLEDDGVDVQGVEEYGGDQVVFGGGEMWNEALVCTSQSWQL